jgi:hypothetical protein
MSRTLTLRNTALAQTGTLVAVDRNGKVYAFLADDGCYTSAHDLTAAEIKSVRRRWYRAHKTAFEREAAFTAAVLTDTKHPCPLCSR